MIATTPNNALKSDSERDQPESEPKFQLSSWVVVKNIPTQDDEENLGHYEGCIGEVVRIVNKQGDTQVYVKFVTQEKPKCFSPRHLQPLSDSSLDIQLFNHHPINQVFWNEEKHDLLERHIHEVEDYIYWNSEQQQQQQHGPAIPEWYLYSLKSSRRFWRIPPEYCQVPPMGLLGVESRFIHIKPRKGYLELTIKSDGQVYDNEYTAFSVLVDTVKDILPRKQRATMSYFQAKQYLGRKIAKCCAVFHVTNAFETPCVTIDTSFEPPLVRESHALESTLAHAISQYLE